MSKIDIGDLPIFDDDYFARKNEEAIDNQKSTEYWQNLNREKRKAKKALEAEEAAKVSTKDITTASGITIANNLDNYEIEQLYRRQGNYADIMAFYEWFLHSDEIPEELRNEAIFYGGTVPYAILETEPTKKYEWEDPRIFGDVDIYVQLKEFKKIRDFLTKLQRFSMIEDSADMFVHNATNDETDATKDEMYNKLLHRDFGYKGSIKINSPFTRMMFDRGVAISLYPIFTESGNICSRGFRYGHNYRKRGDFLLDTMLVEDYSFEDFVTASKILGRDVNIATLEWTIASKQRAMGKEYEFRQAKDEADVDFMLGHQDELGISDEKTLVLKRKIPYYSVQTAYQIRYGKVVDELEGYGYAEAVKYSRSSCS
jgi:hypothetical protein